MEEQSNQKARVRLYASGGAGINLALTMENFRAETVDGFSPLDILYLDTSGSDFGSIDEKFIYRFKEKDGSGALRKESFSVISKYAKEIIQAYPPLDLNILVSSGGGGSGSVLSPVLANELLKMDRNVVVILVGGVDTRILINNTLNTLKSYESISKKNKRSIVMCYLQNESNSKRKEVDDQVRFIISGLCMLFSGENKSLDSKDLYHWINYEKVTTFHPELVSLEAVNTLSNLKTSGSIISVASLAPVNGNTDLDKTVEVQFIGYVPETMPKESQDGLPIHFVTTDGLFEELGSVLKEKLSELDAQAQARVSRESLLDDSDQITDNGLIL